MVGANIYIKNILITDISSYWKCSYSRYDVYVHDCISLFSDGGCSSRNSDDSGCLMVPPLVSHSLPQI